MHKLDKVRAMRVLSLVVVDAILINAAVLGSLLLRFEFSFVNLELSGFVPNYMKLAPFYTVFTLLIFTTFRLYHSLWAYAGIDELRNICAASLTSGIGLYVISKLSGILLPRSLPVITILVMTTLVGSGRFGYRVLRRFRDASREEKQPTLLIGAGAAGSLVLRDLQNSNHSKNKVLCIIDDDPSKHGTYLLGVKVVGGREKIVEMVEKYQIKDIILAMPAASPSQKRAIIALCQKTRCRIQTLPGIYQLASGQVSIQQIRNVEVEDLLGREKVNVDETEIGEKLKDKVILVTGGGGSIGSELCRQVARKSIKKLIIFDIYENNAYDIQQELRRTCPDLDLEVCIGSVRDEKRVNAIFEKYRPDVVCHAAAHKHVPLMEDSPAEAIKNNVFGTYNVACAADKYQAENFLLISTDKAVNPTNIMGASKRICEMIIQTLSKTSKTRFAAVRFGNVLGSNGSVIPLFRKQIAAGGPVTVTHKDIIRYFMTISEAVSLVLQACVYAKEGEVFVLDMGDPVRIDDLARNMIRLSGLEPDVDIKIEYTGLRPGEKLYEELLMQDEGLDTTPNQLIFIGHFNDFDHDVLMHSLEELKEACEHHPDSMKELVKKIVPTYHPSGE
ncbi:MAG: polysaccharide biosynthesis protein [Erysipelotrichaceae bacterium]|nr:polysaccharide biosynthesis protein [Erysipelotrichaceae bacterium]